MGRDAKEGSSKRGLRRNGKSLTCSGLFVDVARCHSQRQCPLPSTTATNLILYDEWQKINPACLNDVSRSKTREGLETSRWLRLCRGARQPHETRVSRWLKKAMGIRAILQENDRSRWNGGMGRRVEVLTGCERQWLRA